MDTQDASAANHLFETTPARTVLVLRNGDRYYLGKKFVINRRVPNFEAFMNQLNEEVEAPFGVRQLYTPSQGHPVQELEELKQGGRYVAAGREKFRKLDYFQITARKPQRMRRMKEIKPVVHSELNVPSRWQTFFRKPREINVLTNGNLHIPPTKLLIPKFTLTDWDNVLAMIGEKVFPLGGVRRLYTMDGCLLGNSDELEDHQFYVAAGKENFKYLPYWDSPKVPKDIQDRFAGSDKNPRRKKREVSEIYPQKPEKTSTKKENSVFYAKKGQKQGFSDHLVTEKNPEGGVFKARTPRKEVQGAPYVKDDKHVQVDVPIDQMPAEMIKEEEYTSEAVATPSGDKKEQKRGWKFMDVFDFLYKPKEKESKKTTRVKPSTDEK
ncbi:doublecortin domain-containing protein 2C isoform X1 [Ornithorhynchus anatinus]|uniref:Doublecortin domain containing 2C n=1 Tax=Ornithorhynchus anatinus TaxID=9258 RepID=A0A6I8PJ65_ORNAN|nr:doublecortin domain-containing protein 2C isoform X1 [Ornithorhynchus anatinus]